MAALLFFIVRLTRIFCNVRWGKSLEKKKKILHSHQIRDVLAILKSAQTLTRFTAYLQRSLSFHLKFLTHTLYICYTMDRWLHYAPEMISSSKYKNPSNSSNALPSYNSAHPLFPGHSSALKNELKYTNMPQRLYLQSTGGNSEHSSISSSKLQGSTHFIIASFKTESKFLSQLFCSNPTSKFSGTE